MDIKTEFYNLSESQCLKLESYYLENRKLYYAHKKSWVSLFNKDVLVQYLNDHFTDFDSSVDSIQTKNILSKDYIVLSKYSSVALYDFITNECLVFEVVTWKNVNLRMFVRHGSYLNTTFTENLFNYFNKESLLQLKQYDQFKYIPLEKLKHFNPYILLNNRFQKEKLWHIEMLLKQDYIRLASDLTISYSDIDWNVFKYYLEFFKRPGKGLYTYQQLERLIEKNFNDPEFAYINHYVNQNYSYNGFTDFLSKHNEINRKRFLKYIKNRKGSKTKFNISFIRLYYMYLKECAELGLDLSKDKYAFPEDLIKAMSDHLLALNPYEYKNGCFKQIFESWQKELPKHEQSEIYVSRLSDLKKAEKARITAAKRAVEQRNKFLKILWDFNKKIQFEIDDNLILMAPTSSEDLLKEGKVLNHCVYSYVNDIAKKEKNIFFLRKKGYKDKPYYTLEISSTGTLVQCRTTNNMVNEEITHKVSSWLNDHKDLQLLI